MKIEISLKTMFFFFAFLLLYFVLIELLSVFVVVFIAFILYAGLKPVIDKISYKYMSRGISVFLVYSFIFLFFSILFFVIFRETANQIVLFFTSIDQKIIQFIKFIEQNFPILSSIININQIQEDLPVFLKELSNNEFIKQIFSNLGSQSFRFISNSVEILFTLLIIVFLSVYMVKSKESFYLKFLDLLPNKISSVSKNLMLKIEQNLGSWVAGMLFLMFVIGIGTYAIIILPSIFDPVGFPLYKYALLIAIIAGILEALPNLGPTLTLIIMSFIGISVGVTPIGLIYIIISFILLQQFEGLFLVPLVMKKSVDLHPILSIIGVLAGFSVAGPIGALLSMPILSIVQILVIEYLSFLRDLEKT